MSAIDTLLAGLIDYAGLYPPASLDMRTAVRNFRDYRVGERAFALGRFIVDAARLQEPRENAGDSVAQLPLSLILAGEANLGAVEDALKRGLAVESVEAKWSDAAAIGRICERLPSRVERYFEIPIHDSSAVIDAIASVGACAKLRMGGVVPEAFPTPDRVVECLRLLADRRVRFKATAGLHHPIRSRHRLTYAADSPCGLMHGFINLACGAALAFAGADQEAEEVLREENPSAFRILPDRIVWRAHEWNAEQVSTIRREFFTSFGSCSFVEPMQDLEALGWL